MDRKVLTCDEIVDLIPQQKPFRFVDAITEVDETRIMGHYRFREDEMFYKGHFPGKPITPGVILLECMCQIGVVAMGIYLLALENSPEEIENQVTLFAEAETEFVKAVYPGERVVVKAEKVFWRRKKLKCKINMYDEVGGLIATAIASGMGVKK